MFPSTALSPAQVADIIKMVDRPMPRTEVLDLLLPANKWKLHQSPYVAVNLKERTISAIPVTQHGAAAFPLDSFEQDERVYKPRSIKQVSTIPGNVANDMQAREPGFLQTEIGEVIADHRDNARMTREAMAVLGMYGTFTYPVNTQNGVIAATQTAMQAVAAPTLTGHLWDATGNDLSDVEACYRLFQESIITATGGVFGTDVGSLVMLVGDAAWAVLVSKLTAHFQNSGSALINQALLTREWIFGGMRIKNVSGSIATYSGVTKSSTAKITAKAAIMVDLNARHFGLYCTLEDIAAQNRAQELFVKQYENENPSGLNILSEQKPFVFPDTRAIAIQTVLE